MAIKLIPSTGNGQISAITVPIPDPGDDNSSDYTSPPTFIGHKGIKRKTTIPLKHPKNYCLTQLSLAERMGTITLIDIARADAMEKHLWVILPEIASDDDLMHDVNGAYNALAIPCIDRHSLPHLWCVRQFTDDGREISTYASAIRAAEFAETHWTLIKFNAGEWEYEEHRHPEKIHAEWPKALARYNDWIENAFAGRIIRAGDHDILEEARGNR